MTAFDRYRVRKMAWLERYGLQHQEEWPLFGVEKYISKAGQVWVYLRDLPPLDGHMDGMRRTLEEIRRLEYRLESEGLVGWLMAVDRGNTKMRYWTERIGAELYATDKQCWHFRKVADYASLPRSIRDMIRTAGGQHGTA
jgi:hypothetical protein